MPEIAFHMLKNDSMVISADDFWNFIARIIDNTPDFEEYTRKRLWRRRRIGTFPNDKAGDILPTLAEENFRLLKTTDPAQKINCDYEFTHQLWRDFFIACKIVYEMKYFNSNTALESVALSEDILSLISDLTREETRRPFQKNPGDDWTFPSKTETSSFPSAEKLLDNWRGKSGESAQNAVYNLINIMKCGRSGNLSNVDFSNLDLRLCRLNGCKFSEFWRDKIYPSKFDNSWLNLSFFVNEGHTEKITALCTNGENLIFSGDSSGFVRCFDLISEKWRSDKKFSDSEEIIDLAWDNKNRRLAVLCPNQLILSDTNKIYKNRHRNKNYRYVRFSKLGQIEVSFNTEPLIFYSVDGEQRISNDMIYDIPSRCAVWHPTKKQFIRSYLLRLVEVVYFNETEQRWRRHPVLQEKYSPQAPNAYIKLEDYGSGKQDRGTDCICYSEDGNKFLLAAGFMLFEFDSATLTLIQQKKFPAKIGSCCYGGDKIILGVNNSLIILDRDFTEILSMKGAKMLNTGFYVRDLVGKFYYLCSVGEIKKIDNFARVIQIRKITIPTKFQWIRDTENGELEMQFLPSKNFPDGCRFNFETNCLQNLGWRYETIDLMDKYAENDETVIYTVGENRSEIMVVNKNLSDAENKIVKSNFAGVYICGCSFLNLKSEGVAVNFVEFLRDNGGKTDD